MISHPLLEKYDWTITNDGIGPIRLGASRAAIRQLLTPFFKEVREGQSFLPFPADVVEELGLWLDYNKYERCYLIIIRHPLFATLKISDDIEKLESVSIYDLGVNKYSSVVIKDSSLTTGYEQGQPLKYSIKIQEATVSDKEGKQILTAFFGDGVLEVAGRWHKTEEAAPMHCKESGGRYTLSTHDRKVIFRFASPGIFSSVEFFPPVSPDVGSNHYFAGSYEELSSWLRNIDPDVLEEKDGMVSYKKGLTILPALSGDIAAPPRSIIFSSEYELGSFQSFRSLGLFSRLTGYLVSLMTSESIEELVQERFKLLSDNENDFRYFGASEIEASNELDELGELGSAFRQLVCQAPERLKGYQEEFLRRNIFHYPLVFLNAPDSIRDALLSLLPQLDQGDISEVLDSIPVTRTYRILESLTWIGDETVQKFFSTLPDFPPSIWLPEEKEEPWWFANVETMIDFKHLPHRAGWELRSDGGRRDLVFWKRLGITHALTEEQLRTATSKFLSVQKGVSELSGAPLFLYFKIDLTDPCFEFLGLKGKMLRLVADPLCVTQGYFELTLDGGCTFVSDANLSIPAYKEGSLPFPEIPHTVSPLPTSPYNTSDGSGVCFTSYLGGLPYSKGFLRHPLCPNCSNRMMFLMYFGGIGGALDDLLQSLIIFLCRECLVVKVIENDYWQ